MTELAELNGPADLAALRRWEEGSALRATWVYTPIGGMIAVCSDTALHMLEFPRRMRLTRQLPRLGAVALGRTPVTEILQADLTAYFAGQRAGFTTPLALHGTPFTQSVWSALRAIPYGVTCTYAGLANDMGCGKGPRAVGRANGANPIAILVPCHRVVGKQGALTGYAGGLWRKEWLLAHESLR